MTSSANDPCCDHAAAPCVTLMPCHATPCHAMPTPAAPCRAQAICMCPTQHYHTNTYLVSLAKLLPNLHSPPDAAHHLWRLRRMVHGRMVLAAAALLTGPPLGMGAKRAADTAQRGQLSLIARPELLAAVYATLPRPAQSTTHVNLTSAHRGADRHVGHLAVAGRLQHQHRPLVSGEDVCKGAAHNGGGETKHEPRLCCTCACDCARAGLLATC